MKIVIAPDSFKESLTALQAAIHIEAGFREIFPQADYVKIPVADGGEGTVQALIEATGGKRIDVTVMAPLGNLAQAFYGLTGDGSTAVIEMAAASGLAMVPSDQRNPMKTTSFGSGELIRAALDAGARKFILGIGGSATNDGGIGMLQALGVRFLDDQDQSIEGNGEALAKLARIDISGMDLRLADCRIEVACDVDNPLTGPNGASAIFGPQKGATPQMVQQLDDNLKNYARVIERDLGAKVDLVPGAGAAGGMGAGMLAFFSASLRPGIDVVMDAVGLDAMVQDADLVITGEGRIDSQTVHGKTPIGVARIAKRYDIPVIGIAGSLSTDVGIIYENGIDAVFSVLSRICLVEEALQNAGSDVHRAARNVAAVLKIGMEMSARG